jgi:UDP-glucose 4-epimerase
MVQKVTGKTIPTTVIDKRAGDPATLMADSSTIREMLGWQPKFADLETIVQTAWDWHRNHPNGYIE